MTIRELKKLLKGLPKNTGVYMNNPRSQYDEHIDRIHIEYDNTRREVYIVLHSDYNNCK